ncbi:general secretion pathway protein GspB [Shewanella livingstonensis]|uniref:General secretion pathway protein GspB n=1 Tax=Shewanella livingstonensis TaxID=150120 RepID=A0A3G8LY22_9GAMM|nr:general secretion pathway protein GspB [Shewanella livingstonensis]AZG74314.1 general secretion pathway protein GspB [Shewanella livingstonensis]
MSILLDAVNRKKQQQENVVDVILTPRAHYSSQPKISANTRKITLLALSIALGVGAAWSMSLLLQAPSSTVETVASQAGFIAEPQVASSVDVRYPSNSTVKEVVVSNRYKNPQRVELSAVAQANDDVRLAGKVALPIAQPFNQNINQSYITASSHLDNSVDAQFESRYQSNSGIVAIDDVQQHNSDAFVDLSLQTRDQPYEVSGSSASSNRTNNIQPIILGANSNRRGQAELEALRLQVNAAAQEVDFASVKAPSIDERNNLLAAFETALKDVEYEQSANQQVTQEKLDPIPRPSNQQIPKYGDLPASIQLQVPEFNINAHVYSSEPNNRWLNVDGVELQQGGMIKNKLTIIEIRPRDIVLEINGEQFRVPAI